MFLRKRILASAVLFGLALAACSNEQAYRAMQENRLQHCETQPIPMQASCREQYQLSYEEYQRLRNAEAN